MSELEYTINHTFYLLMSWEYDNGVFYVTGRDIFCALFGLVLGITLAYTFLLIEYLEERWKYEHRRKNKDIP